MNCEMCGASNHKTEDCPITKKAKLLIEGLYYEEGDEIVLLNEEEAALFKEVEPGDSKPQAWL